MALLGTLVGGIGLFLLGMMLLTDGLKQSAGQQLEQYLHAGTRSKVRGFASGFTLTALVQSSSVVTVATIGFANAGLLTIGQSAWVVFGSNVGTTMTSWIVALVGFKIKVELFALPLVGMGAFLHILSRGSRLKALGLAVSGFGLLFIGLNTLQGAMQGYQGDFSFLLSRQSELYQIILFTLIGCIMTTLMQSFSAAMAVILTLVNTGSVPLVLGAAAVIGANIGTTSTALLATIGATANAKRVAWAHVIFNLVAAVAAFGMLPLVSEIFTIGYERKLMGGNAAFWLAVYHTLFNFVGVLIMIFIEPRITAFLTTRFVEQDRALKLQYVDATSTEVPAIAARSVIKEFEHLVKRLSEQFATYSTEETRQNGAQLRALLGKLDGFVVKVLKQPMDNNLVEGFNLAIKNSQTLSNLTVLVEDLHHLRDSLGNSVLTETLNELTLTFQSVPLQLVAGMPVSALKISLKELETKSSDVNDKVFQALQNKQIHEKQLRDANALLDVQKRIAKLLVKLQKRREAMAALVSE
ncbi:Na/Pi cotransporter family protein [Planctobacterium marinum]|uniref:Na/Pi cotransporter family protein n=1 Tax=Planctobacterium marinum TaxID=1631968 RepID=UPI001E499CA0|nr:Na/Pi symporter [Planctobacterium marinum]MCC2603774.1 Na/Pi symporter [Planctobacterium marinum]